MQRIDPALLHKWYKKAATCPCKPKCRPLRMCPVAVPMDNGLGLFGGGAGSGGNVPGQRNVSFVQIEGLYGGGGTRYGNGSTSTDTSRVVWEDILQLQSEEANGSSTLADHPTAVL